MRRQNSSGFTLLEMMVVIVLLGLLATIIVPRLTRRNPEAEWIHIVDTLNNMVGFARQESIVNQCPYRLAFYAFPDKEHAVVIEQEVLNPEKKNAKIYIPASSNYFPTRYTFSPEIKIINIVLNKKSQFNGQNVAYCNLIPEGLVQAITLYLKRIEKDKESTVTLTMLPFLGKFDLLEGKVEEVN